MMSKCLSPIITCLIVSGVISSCEKYEAPEAFNAQNSLSTAPATNVTRNSATINGQLSISSKSIRQVGFRYSTSSTMSEYQEVPVSMDAPEISCNLTGLIGNTSYYYCIYASGGYNTVTSGINSFTTVPYSIPSVNKPEASDISEKAFALTASTLDKGGSVILDLGFQYLQIDDVESFDRNFAGAQQISCKVTSDIADITKNISEFKATITGLNSGKLYAIRSFCQNGQGTGYSDAEFVSTTSFELSEVTVSNVNSTIVQVEAQIVRSNNSTIEERGFICSTSNFVVHDESLPHILSKDTEDRFSAVIEGLKETTTYYIGAYVTTQYGTSMGPVRSFVTSEKFSVSPMMLDMESDGGSKTITVASIVPFTVKKDVDWLSVKTDDNVVTVSAEANTARESREGHIVISPDDESSDSITVLVYQAASSVYFEVDTTSLSFTGAGGTCKIKVNATDSWYAKTDASWLTLSPSSGKSDAEISVTALENYANKDRDAVITIASSRRGIHTVNVNQVRSECFLSTNSATTYNINKEAQLIELDIVSNVEWIADVLEGDSWCKVFSSKGANNGSFILSVKENPYFETRIATIRVKGEGDTELYFHIIQGGSPPEYSVDKSNYYVSSFSDYDLYVKLSCNMEYMEWMAKVEEGVSWLHIVTKEGVKLREYSSKGSILHIYVDANASSATTRSSKVSIFFAIGASLDIFVTQEPNTSIILNDFEDDVIYE